MFLHLAVGCRRAQRLKIERAWIPYLKRLFAPPDVQLPEQAPMVITHATKEYNPLEDDWKWEKLTWLSYVAAQQVDSH